MRKVYFLVALVMAFAVTIPVMAEQGLEPKVGIYTDFYNNKGDITYEISGSDFAFAGDQGKSTLKFPIDTNFYRLGVQVNLMKRIDISFDHAWSVNSDAGEFTDLDYSSAVGKDGEPFITGRADSEIDAKEWNLDFKYLLTKLELDDSIIDALLVKIGIGHKNQDFEYDIKDAKQSSVYFPSQNATIPGKVIDYEAEYAITYLSLYLDLINSSYDMKLLLGVEYAPNAELNDKDDHVLRSKLSESTADGTYTKLAAKLDWNVWQNLFAAVYYNYIMIDVSGDQDQSFYDGVNKGLTYNNVDYTNESEQSIWGLQLSWLF